MTIIKRERRCTECKRKFATPESFRAHRYYEIGSCRSVESLAAAGYIETGKGWILGRASKNK